MYDDGTMVSGSLPEGLSTADIAGKVFTPTSGKITLELDTSATRSSKGFLATWSIGMAMKRCCFFLNILFHSIIADFFKKENKNNCTNFKTQSV